MNELKRGIYRHYKGNRYELLDIARHSETLEDMVVYRQLYGDGGVWVRPASMWFETVEHDGKKVLRFTPESNPYEPEEVPEITAQEDIPSTSDKQPETIRVLTRFYG